MGPDGRSAKSAEGSIRQHKRHNDLDSIRRDRQKPGQNRQQKQGVKEKKLLDTSGCYGTTHLQKKFLVHGKVAVDVGR